MCISLATMTLMQGLSIAGTAVSAIGAIQGGRQEKAMGNYQAEQAAADADASRAQAQIEAAKIRREGERAKGAARASLAASGVGLDTGTADIINREITYNAEEDALTTIMNGNTSARKLNAQGQGYRIAGNNAMTASALRAGGAIAKGWRSSLRPGMEE